MSKQTSYQLIDAVILNDWGTVQELLAVGVVPDTPDREHKITPLMFAVERGFTGIAEGLICAGANVNQRDDRGQTPLMYAQCNLLELLRHSGANLDTTDQNGETALIKAIQRADTEKALWLIQNGANRFITDADGLTAFDHAVELGLVSLIKYFSSSYLQV